MGFTLFTEGCDFVANITSGDHFSLTDRHDGLSNQNSVHENRIAECEVAEGKLMFSRDVS